MHLLTMQKNGVRLNCIEGGWKTNINVRPERDWEKSLGRAFTKKKE